MADLQMFALRDELAALRREVDALKRRTPTGVFVPWAPIITGSVSDPTIAATAYAGSEYLRMGDLFIGFASFKMDAGFAGGSGQYRVSTPWPLDILGGQVHPNLGQWVGADDNTGLNASGAIIAGSLASPLTYVRLTYNAAVPTGASSFVTNTTPWTWAANDQLRLAIVAKVADGY